MATKMLGVDVGRVGDKVGEISGGLGGSLGDLGSYLKEQRQTAQLSLRQLAEAAGVSNPYLSQVERGLRRPSAEVLQQIARGLRISAEVLYVRAGIMDERVDAGEVRGALLSDPYLSERQRQVLLEIYATFRAENQRREVDQPATAEERVRRPGRGGVEPGADDEPGSDSEPGTAAAAGLASGEGTEAGAPATPRRRRSTSSSGTGTPSGTRSGTRSGTGTRRGGRSRTPGAASTGADAGQGAPEGADEGASTARSGTARRRGGRSRTSGEGSTSETPTPAVVAEKAEVVAPQPPSPEELVATHDPEVAEAAGAASREAGTDGAGTEDPGTTADGRA